MNKRLAGIVGTTIAASVFLGMLGVLIMAILQEPTLLIPLGVIAQLILTSVLIAYSTSTNSKESK